MCRFKSYELGPSDDPASGEVLPGPDRPARGAARQDPRGARRDLGREGLPDPGRRLPGGAATGCPEPALRCRAAQEDTAQSPAHERIEPPRRSCATLTSSVTRASEVPALVVRREKVATCPGSTWLAPGWPGRIAAAARAGRDAAPDPALAARRPQIRPTTVAMTLTPTTMSTSPMASKTKPERIILVMGMTPLPYTMAFGGVDTGSMNP